MNKIQLFFQFAKNFLLSRFSMTNMHRRLCANTNIIYLPSSCVCSNQIIYNKKLLSFLEFEEHQLCTDSAKIIQSRKMEMRKCDSLAPYSKTVSQFVL